MKVLAVDPGLMTGVVKAWIDGRTLTRVEPFEMDIQSFWLMCFEELHTFDVVICESFIITSETGKKTQAPWSLELIGLLRAMCWRADVALVMQKPGEAHEFDRDGDSTKCKRYGLWVRGGAGHAKMAARHFVLWVVTKGGFGLEILKTWEASGNKPASLVIIGGDDD